MSYLSSQASRAILGEVYVVAYSRKIGPSGTIDMLDTTVLIDTARKRVPGLQDGKIALSGPLDNDGSATGMARVLGGKMGVAVGDVFSYAYGGFFPGNPVVYGVSRVASFPTDFAPDKTVDWSMDLVASDGTFEFAGVSLVDLHAITADTNSPSVDNTAATTVGGSCALHVTAYSGFSSVVCKVQHSTDNSSWSDLATFTTVAGKTSEVKKFTGTANRYRRAFADVTGSGSITYQISLAAH